MLLFVVGDPKQAIYSFRGADINAYLKARKEMLEGDAGYYNLPTNRRSMPDLIQNVNSLVSSPQWFGKDNDDAWSINFKPVQYQNEEARAESGGPLLHRDESEDLSMNFLRPSDSLAGKHNINSLTSDLARQIANNYRKQNYH